jgi:type IV pilus assembly protein PilN
MINLLPHREERRKRKKIAFYAGLVVAGIAGLAIVGVWYLIVQQLISGQQERNKYLQTEIAKLDVQIKDIASLKAEIASLKARQKAVEDLQVDRNVPVHVLNELVRQVPEGIYITSVKQDGQNLNVAGIAQTQERVSEFLRNTAYSSVRFLGAPDRQAAAGRRGVRGLGRCGPGGDCGGFRYRIRAGRSPAERAGIGAKEGLRHPWRPKAERYPST